MGLFSRSNDNAFAENTADALKAAVDKGDDGQIDKLLSHLTAEGDPASAAAAIDALRRKHNS